VANDILTFHLASPRDFWLHVRGTNGAHVVVRNPHKIDILPKATLYYAAGLAALNSEMIKPSAVRVQLGRCGDVRKPKWFPPGKVLLLIHERPEQETPSLHR
jgi:predicted ribosome quality control (RQC) complex YloA/Tae2 family protein